MNPGECVIPDVSHLVDQVIACAPQEWTRDTITGAVTFILHRAVRQHLTYGECWAAIWPESDAEWLAVQTEWSQMHLYIDGLTLESVPEPKCEPVQATPRERIYQMVDRTIESDTTPAAKRVLTELAMDLAIELVMTSAHDKLAIVNALVRAYRIGWNDHVFNPTT